jgi:outer membrane protease
LAVLLVPSLGYGQNGGTSGALYDARISPYAFSFSPLFGIKYGVSEEIVYRTSKSDSFLSSLIWEIKPLWYIGGAIDFRLREPMSRWGYFINAAVQAGLPYKTGYMTDRDWMAENNALSHFSKHDNFTEEAWFFDITAGFSLPIRNRIRLEFFAAISFMRFRWDARYGYAQYGSHIDENLYDPWYPSIPKTYFSGIVISYEQNWWIFSPGISAHIPFLRYFEVGFYFQITPLIYCYDFDQHYLRDLIFNENMWGGLMVEPGGKFVFSPYNWLDLSLYVSYRFIGGGPRGATVVTDTVKNTSTKYRNTGGAAYAVLDAGLSITLRY